MSEDFQTAFAEAMKDLLYQSESDEPFEVVRWNLVKDRIDAKDLLRLAGHPENTPVRMISFESFFEPLLKAKPWHGLDEKEDIRKYLNLARVLDHHLSQIQVFRVGSIQVQIYVVGKTKRGEMAGIKTLAIET